MGQITVRTGPERRRRWSEEEWLEILAEAFAPGACVADVSRRRDVSTSLIYTWRRKLHEQSAPGSLPVPEKNFARLCSPKTSSLPITIRVPRSRSILAMAGLCAFRRLSLPRWFRRNLKRLDDPIVHSIASGAKQSTDRFPSAFTAICHHRAVGPRLVTQRRCENFSSR
ncbi:transposase [Croceicoccus mobilis]|uniref:transposase n=1 Tax=Croceicoccus mobilis TaxID=1703339 RepID=UPI0012E821C1|nr:transposase [Croceicoccus mobilis]